MIGDNLMLHRNPQLSQTYLHLSDLFPGVALEDVGLGTGGDLRVETVHLHLKKVDTTVTQMPSVEHSQRREALAEPRAASLSDLGSGWHFVKKNTHKKFFYGKPHLLLLPLELSWVGVCRNELMRTSFDLDDRLLSCASVLRLAFLDPLKMIDDQHNFNLELLTNEQSLSSMTLYRTI